MDVGEGLGRRRGRDEAALEAFERETALPMLVLSLAVIPLLIVPLVFHLSKAASSAFVAMDWLVWAAFAIEFSIRVYLAPRKGTFVRRNGLDVLVIILPFLRPLRVVRSARALRLLRSSRAVVLMGRSGRSAKRVLTRHKLHYALIVGGCLVLGGALLVNELERAAPVSVRTIHSFGDGVCWALATISTVGFGDKFPVTEGGRAVAIVLMLFGVGLFGLIAASFASIFLGKNEDETEAKVDQVLHRLGLIEAAPNIRTQEGPEASLESRLAALERGKSLRRSSPDSRTGTPV